VKAMLEGASKLARLELKALVALQNKSKNKSLSGSCKNTRKDVESIFYLKIY
jgi:hypothetical protein